MEDFSTHEISGKGSHQRFDKHSHISINQEKKDPIKLYVWFLYPCVYCGLDSHCMVNYWKIQSFQEKLSRKEAQRKSCFPKMKDNYKGFKFSNMRKITCIHCGKKGHKREKRRKHFPHLCPKQN